MNKVRLACGHRSEKPYMFEKMMAKVYSVEELCYCIYLDAYLLDERFASEELAYWIGDGCGLPELERQLISLLKSRGSVEEYVRSILEYVGFYPQDMIDETCDVIRDNASKSVYEKGLSRANYYLMSGHILMALSAYNDLLEEIPEKEKTVRSAIWHNCGYAYARMFRFAESAKAFYQSYRILQTEDALKQFLMALRLSRPYKDYMDFIDTHPEFLECSAKIERALEKAEGSFQGTDEFRSLGALKGLREDGGAIDGRSSTYYSRVEEISEALKFAYREMVTM